MRSIDFGEKKVDFVDESPKSTSEVRRLQLQLAQRSSAV